MALSHGIVTVTINPALDVSTSVDRVLPVHKLRCKGIQRDPGGGGINVASYTSWIDSIIGVPLDTPPTVTLTIPRNRAGERQRVGR